MRKLFPTTALVDFHRQSPGTGTRFIKNEPGDIFDEKGWHKKPLILFLVPFGFICHRTKTQREVKVNKLEDLLEDDLLGARDAGAPLSGFIDVSRRKYMGGRRGLDLCRYQ